MSNARWTWTLESILMPNLRLLSNVLLVYWGAWKHLHLYRWFGSKFNPWSCYMTGQVCKRWKGKWKCYAFPSSIHDGKRRWSQSLLHRHLLHLIYPQPFEEHSPLPPPPSPTPYLPPPFSDHHHKFTILHRQHHRLHSKYHPLNLQFHQLYM